MVRILGAGGGSPSGGISVASGGSAGVTVAGFEVGSVVPVVVGSGGVGGRHGDLGNAVLAAYASDYPTAAEFKKIVEATGGEKMDRKTVIEAQLRKLQEELAQIEQFGDDDFEEETVLTFGMKFRGHDTIYKYAAIKANGSWWLTGTAHLAQRIMTWDELVQWWRQYAVYVEVMEVERSLWSAEPKQITEAQKSINTDDWIGNTDEEVVPPYSADEDYS
jgi:hypothetical protein